MPAHRGHGLGHGAEGSRAAHPRGRASRATLIHTWNAVDNAPMQRISRSLGFRPVELELEMQRKDADA